MSLWDLVNAPLSRLRLPPLTKSIEDVVSVMWRNICGIDSKPPRLRDPSVRVNNWGRVLRVNLFFIPCVSYGWASMCIFVSTCVKGGRLFCSGPSPWLQQRSSTPTCCTTAASHGTIKSLDVLEISSLKQITTIIVDVVKISHKDYDNCEGDFFFYTSL